MKFEWEYVMRIDDAVKDKIVEYSKEYFGDFRLYLFGSRVDDTQKVFEFHRNL